MKISPLVFNQILIICGLCIAFFLVGEGASPWVLWPCSLIFYSILIRAFLTPVKIVKGRPTFISLRLLFYIFFFLLFYMPYQLYLLGVSGINESIFLNRTYFEYSNMAIIASTIGILAFDIGVTFGLNGKPMRFSGLQMSYKSLPSFIVSIQIFFISIYLAAGFRTSGEGRYTGTTSGGVIAEGINLIILLTCMITTASLVMSVSTRAKLRMPSVLGGAVSLFWAMRILSYGDRNSFLLISIVCFGGLFTYVYRATRTHLILFLIGALTLYQTIEVARMSETMSFKAALTLAFSGNSSPTVSDSSFNITTITSRAAFAVVPEKVDYGYGTYKIFGLLGVIPLIRGFIFGNSLEFEATSKVLNYEMLPPSASWGVGSNIISDFYIDLGVLGIVLGMFLCGLFAGKVQLSAATFPTSTKVASIYLISIALFSELPRYTADFPIRPIVWAFLLFQLFQLIAGAKSQNASPPSKGPSRRIHEH